MPRITKQSSPRARIKGMSTNFLLVLIAAMLLIGVIVWLYRPRQTKILPIITCVEGPRRLIDTTSFDTQYFAYSVKLEGSLGSKGQVSAELEPKQLQQLTEAMQQAGEFRKWLVNSYNACALSQAQYSQYGVSYQGMDNAARNIQDILDKSSHSASDRELVSKLVNTYLRLSTGLEPSTPGRIR
jgi:hypothetical protein